MARRQETVLPRRMTLIAGADVAYDPKSDGCYAAVVVLSFPSLEIVETATASGYVQFPYIPGYLVFREGPILLKAFRKLRSRPNVVIFDGHGLAHPRRFGIACHLGVLLDIPAIGCGKTRLVGEFKEPALRRGSRRSLVHQREVVGKVLRTRAGVKPVFVSVGHRIRLPDATRLVLRCATRYRLPEPIRAAHSEVGRQRSKGR